jgi:intein-encoded DNA endonuclease-like protein
MPKINEITVRDSKNSIIGWCRDYGDRVNAIHFKKGLVGFYIKASNITFDGSGKIYCFGDGTTSLVRDNER